MTDLTSKTARNTLEIRQEPHWHVIKKGESLGYRRLKEDRGSWIARYRHKGEAKSFKLGDEKMEYEDAFDAAQEIFASCKKGAAPTRKTVEDACRAYVEDLEEEGRPDTAINATKRFTATVYGKRFARIKLHELTPLDVKSWRGKAGSTHCARNRNLRQLKAALNFAYRMQMVEDNRAWAIIGMYKDADGKRELYLSPADRAAFIQRLEPWLARLLSGLGYTGARPGELRTALVKDVDLNKRSIELRTRKGQGGSLRKRHFPLANEAAYQFFKAQVARSKLMGSDYLFPNAAGDLCGESVLSSSVRKARIKGGFADGLVAYTFRHCVISDWLAAGVPVGDVAKLCGTSIEKISSNYHKSIEFQVADKLAAVALL